MALSFALAKAGYADGQIDTTAKVTLDQQSDGFAVTRSALSLTASIAGIEEAQFGAIADDAKANCPISKLLNCEVTLDRTLV
jgi:osmotically inducible protein OsmC